MSLSEIIFRLFAWVRPLLWYYHRLSHFLEAAIRCLEDDDYCLWLFDTPSGRARFESKLVDGERCLEKAIAFRVREILGLQMPVTPRLGIGGFHRIHSAPSLERLAARLDRLIDRYNDIERLARLRAARIRRQIEAAPVLLEADHRPDGDSATSNPNPANLVRPNFRIPDVPIATPAGLRIRAPPWLSSIPKNQTPSTRSYHLRVRALMPSGTASSPSPHAPARTTTHCARR